jgi:hypothetical protein
VADSRKLPVGHITERRCAKGVSAEILFRTARLKFGFVSSPIF